MKTKNLLIPLLAAGALASATAAHATISGAVYQAPTTGVPVYPSGIDINNLPTSGAVYTFDYSGTVLDFTGSPYTIKGFLDSGIGGAGSVTSLTGSDAGTLNNTLWIFTGTIMVANGETLSSIHDDGMVLNIGGSITGGVLSGGQNVIDAAPPTVAELSSGNITLATGTYNFTLIYSEVNGAPGVLQADLTSVPEPSTVVAGALLLLPFGVSTVRILRKNKQA